MKIKKFNIYTADLNPAYGAEPGKIRPVIVVQTDLINGRHGSTLICPLTTQIKRESVILRVFLRKEFSGTNEDSDIIIDQIRAIDNKRLKKKIGELKNRLLQEKIIKNIKILIES